MAAAVAHKACRWDPVARRSAATHEASLSLAPPPRRHGLWTAEACQQHDRQARRSPVMAEVAARGIHFLVSAAAGGGIHCFVVVALQASGRLGRSVFDLVKAWSTAGYSFASETDAKAYKTGNCSVGAVEGNWVMLYGVMSVTVS